MEAAAAAASYDGCAAPVAADARARIHTAGAAPAAETAPDIGAYGRCQYVAGRHHVATGQYAEAQAAAAARTTEDHDRHVETGAAGLPRIVHGPYIVAGAAEAPCSAGTGPYDACTDRPSEQESVHAYRNGPYWAGR